MGRPCLLRFCEVSFGEGLREGEARCEEDNPPLKSSRVEQLDEPELQRARDKDGKRVVARNRTLLSFHIWPPQTANSTDSRLAISPVEAEAVPAAHHSPFCGRPESFTAMQADLPGTPPWNVKLGTTLFGAGSWEQTHSTGMPCRCQG